MEKQIISWEEVEDACSKLVMKIGQSRDWPSKIIAVANGGSVPAVIMSHLMGIRDVIYIRSTHYSNDGVMLPEVEVSLENSLWELCRYEPVLIVDDIYDTGDTMNAVVSKIKTLNKEVPWRVLPNLITATMYLREGAPDYGSIIPTHYGKVAKAGAWLVFPWEKDSHKLSS